MNDSAIEAQPRRNSPILKDEHIKLLEAGGTFKRFIKNKQVFTDQFLRVDTNNNHLICADKQSGKKEKACKKFYY